MDESNPLLAHHLCEIFGVEYEEERINPEEIAVRNAQITKLKQYTDDEEIIKNVDAVAFDQEELADLYEKGVEKIYLCEGKFKIPKSKKNLKYELIGDVQADGLEVDSVEEILHENACESLELDISSIPTELADYIGYKEYVDLDDYVVWCDYKGNLLSYEHDSKIIPFFKNKNAPKVNTLDRYKIWNKKTNEYSSFAGYSIRGGMGKPYRNKMIYRGLKGLCAYDVHTQKNDCLYEDISLVYREFSISDDKVAFIDDTERIIVLDLNSKKVIFKKELTSPIFLRSHNFCLGNGKLFYEENRLIMQYDFDTQKTTHVYKYNIPEKDMGYAEFEMFMYIQKMVCSPNGLYVIFWDKCEWKMKVVKIKTNNEIEYLDCSCMPDGSNHMWFFENNTNRKKNSYLVMYMESKMYILNMLNDEITVYSGTFPTSMNQIQLVGYYLYWGHDKREPSYKVNLTEKWNPIVLDRNSTSHPKRKLGLFHY